MTRRFWRWPDLAFERRNARASERTVLEALSLYEADPRPRTELDEIRVQGLEEIMRCRFGHGAELQRSHRRVRVRPRHRSRCHAAKGSQQAPPS